MEILNNEEGRNLIQWDTDSISMVEMEALCASLKRDLGGEPALFTLSITGKKLPKLSDLKKLLQILEPLVQKGGLFHIYCDHVETKNLLKVCGFPFIAKLIEERPTH